MKIEANLLWSDLVLRRNGDENPEAEGVEIFVQPKGNTGNISFYSSRDDGVF